MKMIENDYGFIQNFRLAKEGKIPKVLNQVCKKLYATFLASILAQNWTVNFYRSSSVMNLNKSVHFACYDS